MNAPQQPPQSYPAPRKKKRRWLTILAWVIILLIVFSLFGEDEYEEPNYGNAFAPPSAQGGGNLTGSGEVGSAQFSDAVGEILAGGGLTSGGGFSGGSSGGHYGGAYQDAYQEVLRWTEEDWEKFWSFMYQNLSEETYSYLTQLDEEMLIEVAVEVYLPNR